MSVDAEKLLRTAFGEIKKAVTANMVVGDPLCFEGKTIIPVVGMSVDFGGGGGSAMGKGAGESEACEGEGCSAEGGAGGGAGGGFTIKPVALIIIDEEDVRIEPLKIKHLKFEKLSAQSPYQPPSQPPSGEPSSESGVVDSDHYLAKEVSQLSRDVKELQTKLGITPGDQ